jgi:hypothetical protein
MFDLRSRLRVGVESAKTAVIKVASRHWDRARIAHLCAASVTVVT